MDFKPGTCTIQESISTLQGNVQLYMIKKPFKHIHVMHSKHIIIDGH